MKIFFYAFRPFDELPAAEKCAEEYGFAFDWSEEYPTLENLERVKGCDAISCTPCEMSEPYIRTLHECGVRYLCTRSIGYDHIDLDACRKYGIRVSNVSYPPEGVADYTILCILMCERKIKEIMNRFEIQDFSLKGKLGRDISRLTIGIIGTGKIGTTLMKHLSGFGCRMLAYDVFENEEAKQYGTYCTLSELFQNSDVITVHANATEENHHLLNEEAFGLMKDHVTIINTSRGKLIDTRALIRALKSGKVGACALDVLEDENGLYYYNLSGQVIDHPDLSELRSFPNVLVLPHTAFYTETNVEEMVRSIFDAVDAFEKGRPSSHIIL